MNIVRKSSRRVKMSKQGASGPDLDKMEEGRGFFYFFTELQSYKWVDMAIAKAKVLKKYKEGSCRNRRRK